VTFETGSWRSHLIKSSAWRWSRTGLIALPPPIRARCFWPKATPTLSAPTLTTYHCRIVVRSVALVLSQQFGVPAENLTTQGYGEQYLKVPTQGPERANRRVTVRRITPLLTGQNEAVPVTPR
jgi:hypothetical protein